MRFPETWRLVVQAPNPAVPRQDHARLCRRAGDLGRQHGLCLSRFRACFRRRGFLPAQRAGGRSGARHRSRTDLLPLAGPLFRGDRQGRGRQGGAGGRSQPEGRHHRLDEGHHQPGAARADRETGAGIPRLHQDFRRHPQGQGRERADRAKPAHAHRQLAALQARRSPEQCRRRRAAGDHARREEGDRAVSGGDGARQYVRGQFGQDGRGQRAGAPEIRRELAEGDFVDQRKDPGGDQGSLRHAGGIPAVARQADRQCQGDRRADPGNDGVGRRHQQGLGRDEVGPAGRSEAARSRIRMRPSARPNG